MEPSDVVDEDRVKRVAERIPLAGCEIRADDVDGAGPDKLPRFGVWALIVDAEGVGGHPSVCLRVCEVIGGQPCIGGRCREVEQHGVARTEVDRIAGVVLAVARCCHGFEEGAEGSVGGPGQSALEDPRLVPCAAVRRRQRDRVAGVRRRSAEFLPRRCSLGLQEASVDTGERDGWFSSVLVAAGFGEFSYSVVEVSVAGDRGSRSDHRLQAGEDGVVERGHEFVRGEIGGVKRLGDGVSGRRRCH